MKPELSVILPVHNQGDHIAQVVERYQSEFKNRPWEIILVPNACRDDSLQICRRLARKSRNIRTVENPAGGWGLSVRMGLQAARGRFLCYTNSARTDPSQIPPLFRQLRAQPGSVFKISRVARGHLLREFGSRLYNWECRLLFHVSGRDVNGTPKMFSADLFGRMELVSDGDLLDAEFLARCRRMGVPVLETILAGWTRHGGQSTTKFRSAVRMYAGAVRLWRTLQ
jgi:glycosyltransferase involved in cell wall biosynthesis